MAVPRSVARKQKLRAMEYEELEAERAHEHCRTQYLNSAGDWKNRPAYLRELAEALVRDLRARAWHNRRWAAIGFAKARASGNADDHRVASYWLTRCNMQERHVAAIKKRLEGTRGTQTDH